MALGRCGKRLYDKALPNDEDQLRAMIAALRTHGQLWLSWISPPPSAPCHAASRAEGIAVGCLPGLAMRAGCPAPQVRADPRPGCRHARLRGATLPQTTPPQGGLR